MVAPMCRLMLLLLLLSVVRGCWGGGFDDVVVESAAPGSGEASWRILEKLGRSRLLVGLFVYPSSSSLAPMIAFLVKAVGGMFTNLGDQVGV